MSELKSITFRTDEQLNERSTYKGPVFNRCDQFELVLIALKLTNNKNPENWLLSKNGELWFVKIVNYVKEVRKNDDRQILDRQAKNALV